MHAEDRQLMTQILESHNPDGRELDVKSLLQLAKSITLMTINETKEKQPRMVTYKEIQPLAWCQVHLAAVERKMQDVSKVDKRTTAVSVLKELSQFGWDAKAVMVFASFAINHGIWMLAQMYSASSPALQAGEHNNLHEVLSRWITQVSSVDPYYFYLSLICSFGKRPKADQLPKPALTKVFQALIKAVECIIELQELPSADLLGNGTQYETAMADVPITVYHISNIVIFCTAVINKFPSNDYEISEADENELSSYALQLHKRTEDFTVQIIDCNQFLEETRIDKRHQIPIPVTDRTDNREALEFLMNGGADQLLRNEVDKVIHQLKGKHVILHISDEESSELEQFIIYQVYTETTTLLDEEHRQFSILWIPLYSGLSKELADYHFRTQKKVIRWFTVPHPSVVSVEAAKFIKEKWQFQGKSNILVVLDPQGTVLNINAFHMICIWGPDAFPFARSRERVLWKSYAFSMDFILDRIDPIALEWIRDDRYVLLYGSDDIDWIRKFATSAKRVAMKFNIPMELLYIGKPSNGIHETRNKKIKDIIQLENLSNIMQADEATWFFWSRLQSMVISKMSHQRGSETEDLLTRQLKLLLGYETERSWAVLGKGRKVVAHRPGRVIFEAMMEMGKEGVGGRFEEVFVKAVARGKAPCCQVEFPVWCTGVPETLKCPNPNCKLEEMDKSIVFQCCHPGKQEDKYCPRLTVFPLSRKARR